MTQSVGRDFSVAETNVDSHEHTTRRMIYTRLDVSTGHILKMVMPSDQLPQFIDGQRTSTRRQKCSDIDSEIRLEERFNILLIDLLLSNRRGFKRGNYPRSIAYYILWPPRVRTRRRH